MMRRPVKRPPTPPFGSLKAVDPKLFMLLPPAMQGEGVRLMLEFGATRFQIVERLGLSDQEVRNLAAFKTPFQRDGEVIQKED